MQIGKYFKDSEFACKDGCGANQVDLNLIKILDDVREHFNKPVIIVSGRRCEKHNRNVGGAKQSQHLLGTAADIKIKDVSPKLVADYLESKFPENGIGRYKTFTHIDVRGYAARWGSN